MLINCDPTCSSLLPEDRVCRPPSLSDVNGRKLHFEAFALSAVGGETEILNRLSSESVQIWPSSFSSFPRLTSLPHLCAFV